MECNAARFIPGRRPRMVQGKLDDRIFFGGMRYSSTAEKTETEVVAGIGFGPGQHLPMEDVGPGFKMSPGGLVIPTQPSDDFKTIPVRNFTFTEEQSKKRQTRQYIDFTTFREMAPGIIRAMPLERDNEVYYEIWSGHPEGATEETKQLIQANMFISGAVAYSGATTLLDTASTEDITEEDKLPLGDVNGTKLSKRKMATLMKERVGDIFCGVFLWTSRLYRVRFSRKDSEAVLVRHLGKAWMLTGKPKVGHEVHEMPSSALPTMFKRFERLSLEQPLKLPEQLAA
ncbi:MAG TPA: hypothetical protein VMH91_03345 [Candidatus Paceibacterota bacterium]|nr:hypothetical protein [Candidatus Paceibacterota bacterium]